MTRIGVTGAGGRMGRALIEAIGLTNTVQLTAALERPDSTLIGSDSGELAVVGKNGIAVAGSLQEVIDQFDVLIDFSTPDNTIENARLCAQYGKKIVIGTTGLNEQQLQQIIQYASQTAVCMSSNFATGVNLCFKLAELAAKVLGDEVDVEISETHHRHKVDAPSGTALSLGEYAAAGRNTKLDKTKVLDRTKSSKKRKNGDIGFSVTRGGEIAGEHTVSFISKDDRIDLYHKANNRSIFVSGALKAAVFLSKKKKGYFEMKDLLKI